MESLSEIFSNLYNKTTIFFTLLLLNLMSSLLQSLSYALYNSGNRLITTTQFLNLIEEKFPTLVYKKTAVPKLEPSNHECSVCLSIFESGDTIRKLYCNHTFHRDCIDKWMQRDYAATCPLCRREVLSSETLEKFRQRLGSFGDDCNDFEELVLFFSNLHGTDNFIS